MQAGAEAFLCNPGTVWIVDRQREGPKGSPSPFSSQAARSSHGTHGTPAVGSLLCEVLVPKFWHVAGLQFSDKHLMLMLMLRPMWEHLDVPGGGLEIVG